MKRLIRTSLLLMATALFAACTNDIVPQKGETKKPATTYVATFTGSQPKTTGEAKTRTTATHTRGGAAQVYWETTDRIWVKADDGTFQQSEPAQYQPYTPVNRSFANFALTTGSFTKPSTEVRYTNTSDANTVVIASAQAQSFPNKFSHLGAAGDCGTATSQGKDGNYKFTLQHKASYLCFVPRCMNTQLGHNTKLTKIVVTADKPIAGTYDFSDGSLMGKTPAGGSNTITLTLTGGNAFSMNTTTENIDVNGAYIVIAPGTYNLTITYTLQDNYYWWTTGDITKTLNGFTCPEGQIRDITANLTPPPLPPALQYYMWDAKFDYWHDHLNPDGTPDGNWPQNNSDPRWYNESFPGIGFRNDAQTELFKTLPNVNELCWYVMKGDIHKDRQGGGVYVANGHLQVIGGIWLRKKSAILAYLKANEGYPASFSEADLKAGYRTSATAAPTDYRVMGFSVSQFYITTPNLTIGRPSNTANYFFLRATGIYSYGSLINPEVDGFYWASNSYPMANGDHIAYCLCFSNQGCGVSFNFRSFGAQARPFE